MYSRPDQNDTKKNCFLISLRHPCGFIKTEMVSFIKTIECISLVMVNSHESNLLKFMVRQVQATRILFMKYGYILYVSDNIPEDTDKQEYINLFRCSCNARVYVKIPFRKINKIGYFTVIQGVYNDTCSHTNDVLLLRR